MAHNAKAQPQHNINLSLLRQNFQFNDEVIDKILGMLIADLPRRAKGMQEAYDRADWHTLFLHAHSLIPSAKYIGVDEMENDLRGIMLLSNQKKGSREFASLLDVVSGRLLELTCELSAIRENLQP